MQSIKKWYLIVVGAALALAPAIALAGGDGSSSD